MKWHINTGLTILFLAGSITCKPDTKVNVLHPKTIENMADTIAIVIKIETQAFQAILYNNPTSKSLLERMPVTVEVEDYAGIEKVFYPKPGLSAENAPSGADPSVGDIMYYAPWGDVAIFYKDFKYADGLIPMGRIENVTGFVNALARSKKVTIEEK